MLPSVEIQETPNNDTIRTNIHYTRTLFDAPAMNFPIVEIHSEPLYSEQKWLVPTSPLFRGSTVILYYAVRFLSMKYSSGILHAPKEGWKSGHKGLNTHPSMHITMAIQSIYKSEHGRAIEKYSDVWL
jgi:hypothetical protein